MKKKSEADFVGEEDFLPEDVPLLDEDDQTSEKNEAKHLTEDEDGGDLDDSMIDRLEETILLSDENESSDNPPLREMVDEAGDGIMSLSDPDDADDDDIIELTDNDSVPSDTDDETELMERFGDEPTVDIRAEHHEPSPIAELRDDIAEPESIFALPDIDTENTGFSDEPRVASGKDAAPQATDVGDIPVFVPDDVRLPEDRFEDILIPDEPAVADVSRRTRETVSDVPDLIEDIPTPDEPTGISHEEQPIADLTDRIEDILIPDEPAVADVSRRTRETVSDVPDLIEDIPTPDEPTGISHEEQPIADLTDRIEDILIPDEPADTSHKEEVVSDLPDDLENTLLNTLLTESEAESDGKTETHNKSETDDAAEDDILLEALDDVPVEMEDIIDLADVDPMSDDVRDAMPLREDTLPLTEDDHKSVGDTLPLEQVSGETQETDGETEPIIELTEPDAEPSVSELPDMKQDVTEKEEEEFRVNTEDIIALVEEKEHVAFAEQTMMLNDIEDRFPAEKQRDEQTVFIKDIDDIPDVVPVSGMEEGEKTLLVSDLDESEPTGTEEIIDLVESDMSDQEEPSEIIELETEAAPEDISPAAGTEIVRDEHCEQTILLAGTSDQGGVVGVSEDALKSALALAGISDDQEKTLMLSDVQEDVPIELSDAISTEKESVSEAETKTAGEEPVAPAAESAAEADTSAIPPGLSVPQEQVEAVLERVIRKMFSDKLERILMGIIERAVTKELNRIKNLLIEDLIKDLTRDE